jgi:hypothetical protein
MVGYEEVNQFFCFYPLSFCLYPLERGGSYLSQGDHGSRATGSHFIPYPFALILFKGETRARLFAFFPPAALIIHPCLNASAPSGLTDPHLGHPHKSPLSSPLNAIRQIA